MRKLIIAVFDRNGGFVFVEQVGKEVMYIAIQVAVFCDKALTYGSEVGGAGSQHISLVFVREIAPAFHFAESSFGVNPSISCRNDARKARYDGGHAQLLHAAHDLFLQFHALVNECLWQGTVVFIHIAHALPGQEGRSCEERGKLFRGDAKVFVHLLPHNFLTNHGQRHVDAMQGHPVEFFFPIGKVPEGGAVTKGADIVILAEFIRRYSARNVVIGKGLGKFYGLVAPCILHVAGFVHVVVGTMRHGYGA